MYIFRKLPYLCFIMIQLAGVVAVEVTGGPEVPFHPGRPVSEISFTGYKLFIIFCGVMHLFAVSFIVAVGYIFRKELSHLNCTTNLWTYYCYYLNIIFICRDYLYLIWFYYANL